MIQTQSRPTPLSLADLPGPDTATKRAALEVREPRLQLMLQESAATGWPVAYTDDLYRHDTETLAAHPGQPMLWILREHGTHLYPLPCENRHEASYYCRVIDYWSGDHKLNIADQPADRARFYIVTDLALEQVTATEAQNRIRARTNS